jgi:hypothetical protein
MIDGAGRARCSRWQVQDGRHGRTDADEWNWCAWCLGKVGGCGPSSLLKDDGTMSATRGRNAQMDKQRMLTTREHRRPGGMRSALPRFDAQQSKGGRAAFKPIPTQLRLGSGGWPHVHGGTQVEIGSGSDVVGAYAIPRLGIAIRRNSLAGRAPGQIKSSQRTGL